MNPSPGEIVADHNELVVGCGNSTALKITELQLEGKKRMSAREFLNGYRPVAGERLGNS
jgi:methionyl-tRNA formyltransferase